jgi:hypothetical protein
MSEIAQYILSVIVIPALVAAIAAVPVVLWSRRAGRARTAVLEGGLAFALMAAFVLSFTRELGWNAILRQLFTIENDDAPFERWHRVGLAALAAAAAGWVLTAARATAVRGLEGWLTVLAVLLAAVWAALFVRFPGMDAAWQVAQGALVAASALGYAVCARGAALWVAWGVFGVLAMLAGLGGFASLSVMSGAISVGAFLIAALVAVVGRRGRGDARASLLSAGGAVALALGTLTALVATCGFAYAQDEFPKWAWFVAALLPFGGYAFAPKADRAPSAGASTFWRFLGAAILAVALLASVGLALRPDGGDAADDAADLMEMYG